MKKQRINKSSHTFLFLLPSLFGVGLFFFLPFGVIIYYSLISRPVNGTFVGLKNFIELLRNKAFLLAVKNTIILLFSAVPPSILIPLLLALVLERSIPMKSQLRTAFLSPMFVPVASVVLVWQVLFHRNGTINAILSRNIDWFHSPLGYVMVLFLFLWKNIGYHTILFTAGLAAIPQKYIDMAYLDGAGRFRQFFLIKLRFLAPTILFVLIMGLIATMKIFREIFLLAGAYPYESLYLLQHFMNNTFQTMDYQKLCSAAILLATVFTAVISVLLRLERKTGEDMENE